MLIHVCSLGCQSLRKNGCGMETLSQNNKTKKGGGKERPLGLPSPQFHFNLADKIIILRFEGEKKAPLSHEEVSSSLSDFGPFA